MPKFIENKLIEVFKDRGPFGRNELYDFYLQFEPNLKEKTFSWRIYDLKKKNIIRTVGRGLYVISYKPKYVPVLSENILKIARNANERFSDIKYCIWETQWLNEFTQLQSSNAMIVLEAERDFTESLYYYLHDTLRLDFYLNPNKKEIEFYISESSIPVVIQRFVTRAPVSRVKHQRTNVPIATLEKILVDLFADEQLYYSYQGSEKIRIFEKVIERYSINFTKLFSYAKRRKKEQEIKNFMSSNLPDILENIIL